MSTAPGVYSVRTRKNKNKTNRCKFRRLNVKESKSLISSVSTVSRTIFAMTLISQNCPMFPSLAQVCTAQSSKCSENLVEIFCQTRCFFAPIWIEISQSSMKSDLINRNVVENIKTLCNLPKSNKLRELGGQEA